MLLELTNSLKLLTKTSSNTKPVRRTDENHSVYLVCSLLGKNSFLK